MRSINKIFTLILAALVLFSFLRLSPTNLGQPAATAEVTRAKNWIASALKWLKAWQNEDGGWGQQPHEKSDSRYTAWAMTAMIDAGYPIDSPELKSASDFLMREPWPDYALYIMLRPLIQMGEIEPQKIIEAVNILESLFLEQCQRKNLDDLSFDNYALTLALAGRLRTIQADLTWIIKLQNDDGSFGETQYVAESAIEDKARHTSWALVSLSLFSARNETYVSAIESATEFLKATQNSDGSWGDVKKYSQYVGTTASEWLFSTLSVLHSLVFVRDRTYEPIQKAVNWVVENQPPSGIQESTLQVARALSIVALALPTDTELAKSHGLNGLKVFQTSAGDWVDMIDHKLTNKMWETLDLTVLALNALMTIEGNPFSLSVDKAKKWLLSRQSPEGFWEYNYSKPLYFNFFGYPGTPPLDDLNRIMHTSRVVDSLLRAGINPAEETLRKSKEWLMERFDHSITEWVGMGTDLSQAIIEGVIALVMLGERLNSMPIQKALSILESEITHETTDFNTKALDFFLRIGEGNESDVVQTIITRLIDSQQLEGYWKFGYTQPGYSIYYDFFLTFGVLNSLKNAEVSSAAASIKSAILWINRTWVENTELHSFMLENDFAYHIYSLAEELEIYSFLNNTELIAQMLDCLLMEQNTLANLATKLSMQKIDFFPPYDCGWPSYFSNSSLNVYEKAVSTPEATIKALEILEASGISDDAQQPLVSLLIDFPNEIEVGDSGVGIASIYAVSGDCLIRLEIKAPNSYVYPESQDILLPKHDEKNVSSYITPLKEGETNLELKLFSNDKLIGLRIVRIRAYVPPFTVLDFIYKWGPVLGLVSASFSIAGVAWKIYKWRKAKAGKLKKGRPRSKRSKSADQKTSSSSARECNEL